MTDNNIIEKLLRGAGSEDDSSGNTGLPFGLCEKYGIQTGKDWTPRDAWDALDEKLGMKPEDFYDRLKEEENIDNDVELSHSQLSALQKVEDSIRGRKTEKGYIIGESGEMISVTVKSAYNKAKFQNVNMDAISRTLLTILVHLYYMQNFVFCQYVFKGLPKLLENPAIIMESTKKGSIVAFVDAVDNANNPIVCAIKINGKGCYNSVEIESNVLASVYGKDTNPIGFIENAVKENRVFYWNKKISQRLFEIPGLQLPDNLNNLDSNIIIRKANAFVNTYF